MTATQDSPLRNAAGMRGRHPVAVPLVACLLLFRAPAAPCAEPAAPPATQRSTPDLLAVLRQGAGDDAPAAEALTLLTARTDRLSADERRQAGTQALALVRRLTGMTNPARASIPAALALIDAMPPPGAAEVLTAFIQARTSRLEALMRKPRYPFLGYEESQERQRLGREVGAALKALRDTDAPLGVELLVRAAFTTDAPEAERALVQRRSPDVAAALITELGVRIPKRRWLTRFVAEWGPRKAARLLSILRPPQGVEPLLAQLADVRRSIELRADAAWALGLYALTSDADRSRIQAALWRFVDASRPPAPRRVSRQPTFRFSACTPPGYEEGLGPIDMSEPPSTAYWSLPYAAPALALCGDPGSLARVESGLRARALDDLEQLRLAQALALATRGRRVVLDRDIERLRARYTLPKDAMACMLRDRAPYLDAVRTAAALSELGRRCDADWRCYAQALDADAPIVQKAALSLAQLVPPAERDAAIDALFAALARRPAPERLDLPAKERRRSWPLLALAKLAPTGACPRCVERLSALVRKGLAEGAAGAYADLEAASLLNRWTAPGR